jgi:hypothetical protein
MGYRLLLILIASLTLLSSVLSDDTQLIPDINQLSAPSSNDCLSCNPENCAKPVGCVSGIVKDSCGCCDVCGKAEYELCDHPKVKFVDCCSPNVQQLKLTCIYIIRNTTSKPFIGVELFVCFQ